MKLSGLRDKLSYILIALLGFAGLALIGPNLYRMITRKPLVTPQVVGELGAVQASDRELLREGDANEQEVVKVLRRYSHQRMPDIKDFVKKYLSHSSLAVRAAALESGGSIDGNPFAHEIEAALNGKEPALRVAAIKAMIRGPGKDTADKLRSFLSRKDIGERERFTAILGLFRLSSVEDERAGLVSKIVNAPPADPQVRAEIYSELFRARANDPAVIRLAQAEVMRPTDSETEFLSLLYLSTNAESWLSENLKSIPISENGRVHFAVVDFLAAHCARGWRDIVNALQAKNLSDEVRRSLDDAKLPIRCALK